MKKFTEMTIALSIIASGMIGMFNWACIVAAFVLNILDDCTWYHVNEGTEMNAIIAYSVMFVLCGIYVLVNKKKIKKV